MEARTVAQKASCDITPQDVRRVVEEAAAAFADGVAGVVVTQGTDTLEETAYLLDLWHAGPETIVVTGAMRTPTSAGADGPPNLLAAVRVAASEAARDLGAWLTAPEQQIKAFESKGTFPSQVEALSSQDLLSVTNPFFNDAPTGQNRINSFQNTVPCSCSNNGINFRQFIKQSLLVALAETAGNK